MPPVGFEPTTPAGERPQTYALDRAATRTGLCNTVRDVKYFCCDVHNTVPVTMWLWTATTYPHSDTCLVFFFPPNYVHQ